MRTLHIGPSFPLPTVGRYNFALRSALLAGTARRPQL